MVPHVSAGVEKLDVSFHITAWQGLGGQSAGSLEACRLLRQQILELFDNDDPFLMQPAATAQPNLPSRADANDGWYTVDAFSFDPETWNFQGDIEAQMTVTKVAP